MKNLAELPGNIMINGIQIDNVTRIPGKGVMIKDRFARTLAYIREDNDDLSLHYYNEVIKYVYAINEKKRYIMDFEMPAIKQAASK